VRLEDTAFYSDLHYIHRRSPTKPAKLLMR
jgi:hypothetical protein